jgi:hypothetical protein
MRTFDNGVWTSEIAARMAEGFRVNMENRIYAYLRDCGKNGATDQEIQDDLNIEGNSERPTRRRMERDRRVRRTTRWRPTRANRPAIVWVARIARKPSHQDGLHRDRPPEV